LIYYPFSISQTQRDTVCQGNIYKLCDNYTLALMTSTNEVEQCTTTQYKVCSGQQETKQCLSTPSKNGVAGCSEVHVPRLCLFLDTFAKFLRKLTINFVMSVRLSAWNNSASPTGRIFVKSDFQYFFFRKIPNYIKMRQQ